MLDEQMNLSKVVDNVQSEQEVTFLTPEWLNVLESDYIDAYDDALDVLEDVPRISAAELQRQI